MMDDSERHTAAGPWKDGPPAEDEEEYLALDSGMSVSLVSWNGSSKWWECDDGRPVEKIIKHAKINPPEKWDGVKLVGGEI